MQDNILTVIPARAGSKGLLRKCLRTVGGVPLLQRTVSCALKSALAGRVIVSTDDPEFALSAKEAGAEVPFLRPAELATDTSSTIDVVLHLLSCLSETEDYRPSLVMLLQPTSPFLMPLDIREAMDFLTPDADAVISVCNSEIKPDWLRTCSPDGWITPFFDLSAKQHTPRQLMPDVLRINGALYLVRAKILLEEQTFIPQHTKPFLMPQQRSLDIDSELDLKFANLIAGDIDRDL